MSCNYLREFSKKIETALMVYSGAWGKLIHEKNQKSKISWHFPFKNGSSKLCSVIQSLQDRYSLGNTVALWFVDKNHACPEAEFLDEIQTKVFRVFLLAIFSHLYSFAVRFLFFQSHATSYSF
jgi:hypothetical protein